MSIIFDLSAAALSSALTVQPMAPNAGAHRTLSHKKTSKQNKNASMLKVSACQMMLRITTELFLRPALERKISRFQSFSSTRKKSTSLSRSTWSSQMKQMQPNHSVYEPQAVTAGPCRSAQSPLSCIHPQAEMPALAAPLRTACSCRRPGEQRVPRPRGCCSPRLCPLQPLRYPDIPTAGSGIDVTWTTCRDSPIKTGELVACEEPIKAEGGEA